MFLRSSEKHRHTPTATGSDYNEPKCLLDCISILPFCDNLDKTIDEEQQADASKKFHMSSPFGLALSFITHNAALSGPRRGVRLVCLVLHSRSAGYTHTPLSAAFPTSGASGER